MTEPPSSAPTTQPPAQAPNGDKGNGPSSASGDSPPSPTFPPGSTGNKLAAVAGILIAVVVFAILIGVVGALRHWIALHTGTLHGGPDLYYNFWSGFGSDLGEATLISAVIVGVYTGVRKVNCHTKGCWRIGHHPLEGTPFILCRHHHPEVPNGGASHEQILFEHLKAKRAREERAQAAPRS